MISIASHTPIKYESTSCPRGKRGKEGKGAERDNSSGRQEAICMFGTMGALVMKSYHYLVTDWPTYIFHEVV